MDDQAKEIELFQVLVHPTRLAILDILRGGEQCVCHMEAILGQRQAYISQQLMVLRDAGLLQDRRDGVNVYYRVRRPLIYAVMDAARRMVGPRPQNPEVAPGTCTCPKCKELHRHSETLPADKRKLLPRHKQIRSGSLAHQVPEDRE